MPDAALPKPGPLETGWCKLFWTAFDQSQNPMLLLRPDQVIVGANEAFTSFLGYSRAELLGRAAVFFVEPTYLTNMHEAWATLRQTGSMTGEREWRRSDGRTVHIEYAAHSESVTGERLILFVVLEPRAATAEIAGHTDAIEQLTPREAEVVIRVALGYRAHEIAAALFLAPTTVRTHIRNAMAKVGARSQAQLVAITLATGMLDPDAVVTAIADGRPGATSREPGGV